MSADAVTAAPAPGSALIYVRTEAPRCRGSRSILPPLRVGRRLPPRPGCSPGCPRLGRASRHRRRPGRDSSIAPTIAVSLSHNLPDVDVGHLVVLARQDIHDRLELRVVGQR